MNKYKTQSGEVLPWRQPERVEMTTVVPVLPPTPEAGSTWQQWDVYLRAVGEVNRVAQIQATRAHAEAQQSTATALQNSVAAQLQMAAAMGGSKPSRAELVFEMVKNQPQATIFTNGLLVDGAVGIVNAFVTRYPDAVRD